MDTAAALRNLVVDALRTDMAFSLRLRFQEKNITSSWNLLFLSPLSSAWEGLVSPHNGITSSVCLCDHLSSALSLKYRFSFTWNHLGRNVHIFSFFFCGGVVIIVFFFLIFLFLLYFILQYCIAFAIHWHESTMGVYKLPVLNPPPTSHPISSLWIIPMHQPQASIFFSVSFSFA